ncbi:MAG: type II secretion system F family protein [Planctomycetales bacterium]|nr:type II secretion system F family protein [Planctomycetales bacterium]
MNAPLYVNLLAIAISAMLAGTLRSVSANLMRRPAAEIRPNTHAFFKGVEAVLWAVCALAIIIASGHPIVVVLIALFFFSVLTASGMRYREEKRVLNRWLQVAAETQTSLPEFLESIADGFRSPLAMYSKVCVKRLLRGESVETAVRRSRLPVNAGCLAAIMIPNQDSTSNLKSLGEDRPFGSTLKADQEFQSSQLASQVSQQLAYIVITMFLAWTIGIAVHSGLLPMLEDFSEEFSAAKPLNHSLINATNLCGFIAIYLVIAWIILVACIRWLPLWMVPLVPWFGRKAIDHWRCETLGMLERGMRLGQAETQILQRISGASQIRWIRKRSRKTLQVIENGIDLPPALRIAKLVSARETGWLHCASQNGTLPEAIAKLCSDIHRRQLQRWKIRMAWVVPLATVLIGAFILMHAIFLFNFMTGLIRGLSS